ncbi:MAG: DEAD/DEAH box helicase, partial [Thermodesulfovibrionales bacterium]
SKRDLNKESFRERILDFIRKLHSGNIYLMASPDDVKKGFLLYSRQAVRDIWWEEDKLVVIVFGHVITLNIKNGGLNINCDCYPRGNNCEHIICCLFTLKNLLEPEVFRISWNKKKRSMLLSSLEDIHTLRDDEYREEQWYDDIDEIEELLIDEEPITRLIFEPEDRYDRIKIELPDNYRNDAFRKIWHIRRNLYKKELYQKEDLDIFLRNKGKDILLTFDPGLRYHAFTAMHYNKQRAYMKKCAKGADGSELIAVDRFVIDFVKGKFNIVDDTDKWQPLLGIKKGFYGYKDDEIPDEVPIESNKIYYLLSDRDLMSDIGFFSKTGETFPERLTPDYVITTETVRYYGKDDIDIKPLIETPAGRFPIYLPLSDLYSFVLNGSLGLIRRYEKRAALIESFFDIVLKDGGATMDTKQFKSSIDQIMNDTPRHKKKDLKHLRSVLMDKIKELMYPFKYRLFFKNGQFYYFPVDIKREVELLKTLYKTFDVLLFRYDFYDSFKIPKDEFMRRLPDLFENSKAEGINISIDKKEMRLSRWEIDLSVIKDKEIDWFELHPEIKINGVPVSEELWLQILEGKTPYVIGKDAIEAMDKETEGVINHLRRLINLNKRPDKKEIVRIPRLQVLDWIELRKKGIRLTLPEEDERVINKLLGFEMLTEKPLPPSLNASLRPYQRDGYNWLCFLYEHRLGGCLADDMGLGKTLQAISLLTAIKDGIFTNSPLHPFANQPNLIIVPPSLIFNWENEIKRFAPQMKVCIYSGADRNPDFVGYDIVITSYGIVRRDIEIFKEMNFHVIILDEAQAIKNIQADTTSAIRGLRAGFKIALTGTPIENHLGEYYSIIDLTLPGLLGDYKDFRRYIKSYDEEIINTIIKRTTPFVLRRTKEEILKELPPKIETEIFLELTPVQKGIYERTV